MNFDWFDHQLPLPTFDGSEHDHRRAVRASYRRQRAITLAAAITAAPPEQSPALATLALELEALIGAEQVEETHSGQELAVMKFQEGCRWGLREAVGVFKGIAAGEPQPELEAVAATPQPEAINLERLPANLTKH